MKIKILLTLVLFPFICSAQTFRTRYVTNPDGTPLALIANALTLNANPTNFDVLVENGSGMVYHTNAPAVSGANLTALNATQLTTGTMPNGRESANTALLNGTQTFSGSNTFTGGINSTNVSTFKTNVIVGGGTYAPATLSVNGLPVGGGMNLDGSSDSEFYNSVSGTLKCCSGWSVVTAPANTWQVQVPAGTVRLWASASAVGSISPFSAPIIIASNGFSSIVSNATMFTLTMPATTATFTNTNAVSWAYAIDNTGVTGTSFSKNGVQIFSGLALDQWVFLRPGETFSETYTIGTPTLKGNVFP